MKRRIVALLIVTLLALSALFPGIALAAVDDSYTRALLHFEGADAFTSFTDESGKTFTTNGNTQVDTAYKALGDSSGLFDGSGDYLSTPNNSDFDFGTGNWTVDTWIRRDGSKTYPGIIGAAISGSGWVIGLDNLQNKLRLKVGSSEVLLTSGTIPNLTWTHIAIVRNGNLVTAYINGVADATTWDCTGVSVNSSGTGVVIGRYYTGTNDYYWKGWIDELRVSKGVARWTSNFTPETNEYGEPTPTPSYTPTITDTPTETFTPTITLTPTETFTPSATFTQTNTPTITLTPAVSDTPTPTYTPNPNIIWAVSDVSISSPLKNALAAVIHATPPSGVTGNVWGLLGIDSDPYSGWYISLAALTGVEAPYDVWNVMENSQWMGSLHCTGTEPTWTCSYYIPALPPGSYNASGLGFPFASGTWAKYGSQGIHHDGNGMLPGDSAVDFMGDDSWSGSMSAAAYAAAAGTVISHCDGAHQGGIVIDGPAGRFMYFHLSPGQAKMAVGTQLDQGERIGTLAYGNWNDSPCGISTINSATGFHLHFAFLPAGSFFAMGGCNLDLGSQNWLCGTSTIYPGGQLNNGGDTSPGGPTPTPGGPTLTPGPGGKEEGGEHVWNGLITGLITFFNSQADTLLPAHTPSTAIQDAVDNSWNTILLFGWTVQSMQIIWIAPALVIYGVLLTIEGVRWVYVIYRYIVGLLPVP